MKREELLAQLRAYTARMVETAEKKNHDYTGGNEDAFYNFTKVEILGIATTEQGFLTRIFDKLARVTTFVNRGILQVADESVEDTLLDLANYSLLMAAYVKCRREADAKAIEFTTLLKAAELGVRTETV